jgi:hypothetical protein
MGAQDHETIVGDIGAVLFPAMTLCGDSVAPECVHVLEQLATVKPQLPLYKFKVDGQQHFIPGPDRPAEICLAPADGRSSPLN